MADSLNDIERAFLARKLGLTVIDVVPFSLDELRRRYWLQGDPDPAPTGPPPEGLTGEELVIRDSPGNLEARVSNSETLVEQIETYLLEASFSTEEVLDTPAETNDFQAFIDSDDVIAEHIETQGIGISYSETHPVQTETHSFEMTTSSSESNATLTETQSLGIFGIDDIQAVHLEDTSTDILAGATSAVSAPVTGSAGWSLPANATGLNNGTLSTVTSNSGITPVRQTHHLTGTYATLGSMALETRPVDITLTFYGVALILETLTAGSVEMLVSTNGGTNFISLQTLSATTAASDYSFTVTIDPANLSSLRFRVTGDVIGGATSTSSASVDAVVAAFSTT